MSNISRGYEQFKKVDAELDKLLLYIEKVEELYAGAIKYKEGYDIMYEYFYTFPENVKRDINKKLIKLNL